MGVPWHACAPDRRAGRSSRLNLHHAPARNARRSGRPQPRQQEGLTALHTNFQYQVENFSRPPFGGTSKGKQALAAPARCVVGENPAQAAHTLGASSAAYQPDWRHQMTDKKTATSRRGMLKGAAVAAGAMSVP
eukprot:Opistho-1_new@69305